MPTEVLLVKAGMTMTEGAVAEWYVPNGGTVEYGQPLYRMETEKIELEVEAEASGTVHHLVAAGATIEPGTPIAFILAPGEQPPPAPVRTDSAPATAVASVPANPAAAGGGDRVAASPIARRLAAEAGLDLGGVAGTGPGGRITENDVRAALAVPRPPHQEVERPVDVAASPLAKRLAEQLGVDLRHVTGTGPGGRITREDVEASAAIGQRDAAVVREAATPVSPPSETAIPIRGMRRVIAERMHASLRDMAQLTMSMDVAMDEATKLRRALIAEWEPDGVRPSYTDLVIKAVAKALPQHPRLNATFEEAQIVLHSGIHIGMAVALDDGLVVPVIRDAGVLPFRELCATSSRLVEAARTGKLGLDELAGGTFSVTSLGMAGVDFFTPVINPPNVAILGVGRIHDGIAWDGDRPRKHQQMTLSLTIDHRAVDGAPGAAFLNTIRELLETPYRLLV